MYFVFADKIHAGFVLQTNANNPVAIVFCIKAHKAFVTPGLYSVVQGNLAWGTHCLISSMHHVFPFWKTGWSLRVWVIPLPCSLLGVFHWCPGELPPAPGHRHQLMALEGDASLVLSLAALLQDLALLKSIKVKNTRLLLGSGLGHSCWSLKTRECFATGFLGNKNWVSLAGVIDRGPFVLQGLLLEPALAAGGAGSSAAAGGTHWTRCCPVEPGRAVILSPSSGAAFRGRSRSHWGIMCPGGKGFPNSYQ